MNQIEITHISTTPESRWKKQKVQIASGKKSNLYLDGSLHQTFEGFGGCFNELGWIALEKLSVADRKKVLDELFDPKAGCRFNFCRMPIGASDYGAEWYSLNENEGDFAMKKFSIKRDEEILIPYIREALKRRKDLKIFASPWSPPTWMKFPKVYNYGTLIWKPEYLCAYALYFVKFIAAYAKQGIRIDQIHVQNEPVADQKFPSCLWTGTQMKEFIRDYLAPAFKKAGVSAEIWLGTLNTDDYNHFIHAVLSDPKALAAITGVGFQWAGKGAIARTEESWPGIKLMQTENECGDGKNSWDYAIYIHELIRHYLSHGANAYVYWNMVLEPRGKSSWGWEQNSMVVVDPKTRKATYTPEYYVMKHFSHYINPGAERLGLAGSWTSNSTAFQNPDGSVVLNVCNPHAQAQELTFQLTESKVFRIRLEGQSLNTVVLKV